MSHRTHLLTSEAGIRWEWEHDGSGNYTIHATQDHEPILDQNKAMATHNDGYTPSRDMRRVASIPLILWLKWKNEEGWDAFNPHHSDRLMRKLNDPDYAFLRTAPGNLALVDGGRAFR